MDLKETLPDKDTLEKYRILLVMVYKATPVSDLNSNALNLLNNSFFTVKSATNWLPNSFILEIIADPSAYAEAKSNLRYLEQQFQKELSDTVDFHLFNVVIKPDLNKIYLLPSTVEPVKTTWEDVNQYQEKLIDLLKVSSDKIDYRNIGNTARSLLHHLASMVFDPSIHNKLGLDIKGELYKNQLKEFIQFELEGKGGKKLRNIAKSSVSFVFHSIDLMNNTTHKLEAKRHMAELCVIGAISTVRIVKIITELDTQNN